MTDSKLNHIEFDGFVKRTVFTTKSMEKINYIIFSALYTETFEERPILAKYKEGDNFNRRNTLSISRIEI